MHYISQLYHDGKFKNSLKEATKLLEYLDVIDAGILTRKDVGLVPFLSLFDLFDLVSNTVIPPVTMLSTITFLFH